MHILVVNGPNLNLLGTREPELYGTATLEDLQFALVSSFEDVTFTFYQSNHEGELIDALQKANADGIVFNGAGFTHTSVALRDAIASIDTPVVEVHISNIAAREEFRHHSITAAKCVGSITGLGAKGYHLAVEYFLSRANRSDSSE